MLGDGLHDGPVDDDEVLGRGFDGAALARVARIEQQGGALQAHPVALPAALAGQLDLKSAETGMLIRAEETLEIRYRLYVTASMEMDMHTLRQRFQGKLGLGQAATTIRQTRWAPNAAKAFLRGAFSRGN